MVCALPYKALATVSHNIELISKMNIHHYNGLMLPVDAVWSLSEVLPPTAMKVAISHAKGAVNGLLKACCTL